MLRFWEKPAGSLSRKLLTVAIAYATLEVASRCVQSGAIFFLAHEFSKAEFGSFYTYFAIYQFVAAITTGGLPETLMTGLARSSAAGNRDGNHLLPVVLKAFLYRVAAAAIVIGPFAVLFRGHDGEHLRLQTVATATLAGVSYGLVTLVGSYLNCAGFNRASIILRSIYLVGCYGAAVTLVLAYHDVNSFFWGLCLIGSLIALLLASKRPEITLKMFSRSTGPELTSGSAWFMVPSILNWFFWYGLVILVSSYFGATQAADLAFANNISSVLLIINSALSQSWIATYLQHHQSANALTESRNVRVFRTQSLLMLIVTVLITVSYGLLGTFKFPVAEKYGHMGLQISILLFSVSLSSMYFSAINTFAINQRGRHLATLSVAAYFISFIILLLGCWWIGILGVYIGLAMLFISRGLFVTRYAMRNFGAGFVDVRLIAANIAGFALVATYYGLMAS